MGLMISLGDLITIVLSVLGSVLIVYLILAVSKLLKVLKNVDEIVEKNKENIQKTMDNLPAITANAVKITEMAKADLVKMQRIFDDAGKISSNIKSGVEIVQKDILLKIKSILDIIDMIKKMIVKRKENSKKKKSGTVYKYKYKPGQSQPEEIEIVSASSDEDKPNQDYVIDEEAAADDVAQNDSPDDELDDSKS